MLHLSNPSCGAGIIGPWKEVKRRLTALRRRPDTPCSDELWQHSRPSKRLWRCGGLSNLEEERPSRYERQDRNWFDKVQSGSGNSWWMRTDKINDKRGSSHMCKQFSSSEQPGAKWTVCSACEAWTNASHIKSRWCVCVCVCDHGAHWLRNTLVNTPVWAMILHSNQCRLLIRKEFAVF